jgi:poly-gamma-glutamate capsule biosynthesis protein CapA/YwtB (metallophosphatase superfamily)
MVKPRSAAMKKESITLMGVGDVLIDREQPETIFRHVEKVISSADIAYANCEQALSDKGIPNPIQAAHHDSRNLSAFLSAGFDVVSLANNHSLDWGNEALTDTFSRLKAAGLPFVGAGNNLAEAHQPVVLERKGHKVGFLAYSSVHLPGYEATENRPGVAQIRVWTVYDKVDYQPAAPPRVVTIPHKTDMKTMIEDIKKLKTKVDIVVLGLHWGLHLVPRVIPDYCFDIGHTAIDVGADLILGTHPHILKGVEIYKGKAIFYSTGEFALELGSHMRDHAHIKEMEAIHGTAFLEKRRYSMIVKASINGGSIQRVSYLPCLVNNQYEPEIKTRNDLLGQEIYNYIADISRSEHLNSQFEWEGDEVVVTAQN